jgi:hypothetical protein
MAAGLKGAYSKIARSTFMTAIGLIVLSGIGYRAAAVRLERVVQNPVMLPIPLKAISLKLNDWTGRDVELSATVLRQAANDDYINRLYSNDDSQLWANVYVAYSARPRTMLGHRPDVCYVGAGWVRDTTEVSSFKSAGGQPMPCLIHRFHKPNDSGEELVVLNFYIVNGIASADERLFSGLQWRTPNIGGNIARYVAQVQISSALEHTVRTVAGEFIDALMQYLPDTQGRIAATLPARNIAVAAGTQ